MASNGGRRSSAPGNNSSLILGILVGMVVGLAIAGAVAWHLSKRPSAFVNKDQRDTAPAAAADTPKQKPAPAVLPATAQPASAVGDAKQHFTFYTDLPDEEKGAPKGSRHTTTSSAAPNNSTKPAVANSYFLQAGSFSSADEADKLKARLALLGMEASVKKADIAGKGTHYRVRLGPFHNSDEMNKANGTLKENGIKDAAQVHGE